MINFGKIEVQDLLLLPNEKEVYYCIMGSVAEPLRLHSVNINAVNGTIEFVLEFRSVLGSDKHQFTLDNSGVNYDTKIPLIMYTYEEAQKELLRKIHEVNLPYKDDWIDTHYNNIKDLLGKIYPEVLI